MITGRSNTQIPKSILKLHFERQMSDEVDENEKKRLDLEVRNLRSNGTFYERKNLLEEAEKTLDKALALDPLNPLSYIQRSNILAKRASMKEALDDARNALKNTNPKDNLTLYKAYLQNAKVLEHMGEFEMALKNYSKAKSVREKGSREVNEGVNRCYYALLCTAKGLEKIKEKRIKEDEEEYNKEEEKEETGEYEYVDIFNRKPPSKNENDQLKEYEFTEEVKKRVLGSIYNDLKAFKKLKKQDKKEDDFAQYENIMEATDEILKYIDGLLPFFYNKDCSLDDDEKKKRHKKKKLLKCKKKKIKKKKKEDSSLPFEKQEKLSYCYELYKKNRSLDAIINARKIIEECKKITYDEDGMSTRNLIIDTYIFIGWCFAKIKSYYDSAKTYEECLTYFNKEERKDIRRRFVLMEIIKALMFEKKYRKAFEYTEEALELATTAIEKATFYYYRSLCYLNLNDLERANENAKFCVEYAKCSDDELILIYSYVLLAAVLKRMDNYHLAENVLKYAMDLAEANGDIAMIHKIMRLLVQVQFKISEFKKNFKKPANIEEEEEEKTPLHLQYRNFIDCEEIKEMKMKDDEILRRFNDHFIGYYKHQIDYNRIPKHLLEEQSVQQQTKTE